MIFRRAANQRRPADVDLLDRFFVGHACVGHRRFERVQIHDDQLERHDPMLLHRCPIVGPIVPAQNSAVYFGMQRLQSAVHHLWKAGVGGNLDHFQSRLLQMLSRAAGGVQLYPVRRQAACKIDQPQLIAHAYQSTFDRNNVHALSDPSSISRWACPAGSLVEVLTS